MIIKAIQKAVGRTREAFKWWDDILSTRRTASGIRVNQQTALNYSAVFAAVRILAESVGGVPRMGERLTESLVSSSWSSALGDSITRRAKVGMNPSLSKTHVYLVIASEAKQSHIFTGQQ